MSAQNSYPAKPAHPRGSLAGPGLARRAPAHHIVAGHDLIFCCETNAHRIRDGCSANPGGRHTLKWNSRSTLFEVEPATRVSSQSSVLIFDSLSNPSHRPVILLPVGSTNSWIVPRYTAPL
jgi:hypothetical protein